MKKLIFITLLISILSACETKYIPLERYASIREAVNEGALYIGEDICTFDFLFDDPLKTNYLRESDGTIQTIFTYFDGTVTFKSDTLNTYKIIGN